MVQRSTLSRDDADANAPVAAISSPVGGGRLGVYSVLGGYAGAVPIPWVPGALSRRVRGALVQEVAARRGLSLAPEARDILADPAGPDEPHGLASSTLRYVGWRVAARALARLGPLGFVWPLRRALETYALGHLFDRYLEIARRDRAARIGPDEARRLRRAVDGALARAFTVKTPPLQEPAVVDDQRDPMTVVVDAVIGLVAGVPERLLRRLDTAFDELIAQAHG